MCALQAVWSGVRMHTRKASSYLWLVSPCLGLQEVSSAMDVVTMFEGSLSFADNLTMIANQVNARTHTHTHAYKALCNVCHWRSTALHVIAL